MAELPIYIAGGVCAPLVPVLLVLVGLRLLRRGAGE